MKCFVLILAVFAWTIGVNGQSADKPIQIGDRLPDLKVKLLQDGKIVEKQIADLNKGKLLILDFWATWCSPCIRSLKPFSELNKQFKDSVLILPVTYEDEKKASTFLNEHFKHGSAITSIVEDSLLSHNFPHRIIPHEVWIGSDGIVRAITNGEDVTKENIQIALNGKFGHLRLKKENMKFNRSDYYKPSDSAILFRSLLTRHDPSIGGFVDVTPTVLETDLDARFTRLFCANSSAIGLIYMAFENGTNTTGVVNRNRVIVNVKDTLALWGSVYSTTDTFKKKYKTLQDWREQSAYCYELIIPKGEQKKRFYARMLNELDRVLPYNSNVISEEHMAWAIVVNDSNKVKRSNEVQLVRGNTKGEITTLHGVRTELLEYLLSKIFSIDHVVDRTGLSGTINIDDVHIPWSEEPGAIFDVEKLRKELQANGLDLQRRKEHVRILEISDKVS